MGRRTGRRTLLAGIALGLLTSTGADAAKPTPLAGTVYFKWQVGLVNTMNPSGGDKAALPSGVGGESSVLLHGGHRWFLQLRDIAGELYPGACPRARHEVFAQRDDGDETRTVQLTHQGDLDASGSIRWMAGDAAISWVARRWVGGAVVEGGVYTAPVVFDSNGDVVGLAAEPVSPAVNVPLVLSLQGCEDGCFGCDPYHADLRPDLSSHDWASDGNRVVYDDVDRELWIATAAPAGATRLVTSSLSGAPRWSPAGETIVFEGGLGIWTIRTSGADERQILAPTRGPGGTRRLMRKPSWSPTGTHVLYHWSGDINSDDRSDVYRASSDGSGKTNLTADQDTRWNSGLPAWPYAWR